MTALRLKLVRAEATVDGVKKERTVAINELENKFGCCQQTLLRMEDEVGCREAEPAQTEGVLRSVHHMPIRECSKLSVL